MYIVDKDTFQRAMRRYGYKSLSHLAKSLKLHRNTVQNYLAGQSVLTDSMEKLLFALKLTPAQLFIKDRVKEEIPFAAIASLIDDLSEKFPQITFILFGSRAAERQHKYSDYNIGVFSAAGIGFELFNKLLIEKDKLAEDLPFLVDLLNLNRADSLFLKNISSSWLFLSGKQQHWVALQKRAKNGNNDG